MLWMSLGIVVRDVVEDEPDGDVADGLLRCAGGLLLDCANAGDAASASATPSA
jgi:hypothetical protein